MTAPGRGLELAAPAGRLGARVPATDRGSPRVPLPTAGTVRPLLRRFVELMRAEPGWRPPPFPFRATRGLPTPCTARARILRRMEPA
jgi:hypothetical protein